MNCHTGHKKSKVRVGNLKLGTTGKPENTHIYYEFKSIFPFFSGMNQIPSMMAMITSTRLLNSSLPYMKSHCDLMLQLLRLGKLVRQIVTFHFLYLLLITKNCLY